MKWGKASIGAVFLLILSALLLLLVGDKLYFRTFIFLLLFFVLSAFWSRFSLHGVEIRRYCRNQRMQIGQLIEEKYEVHNNSPFAKLWLEVKDESKLPHSAGSRILTFIGPFQKRGYVCYTHLSRRGLFPLSPITIRSGDIFGIFIMEKTIKTQEKILVTPYLFPIGTGFEPVGVLPGGKAIKSKSTLASPFASGIREYQAGDALNHIHWRNSIRQSKLIVKEFDQDPQADVWLVIDACEKSQFARLKVKKQVQENRDWIYGERKLNYQPESSMDYLSSIGASFAKYYIDKGKAVGLLCIDKSFVTVPAERGERQYYKIIDHLAMIQGIGNVSIRELVTFQSRYLPHGSLVIVISSSPEQEIVAGAVELQGRGFKPVILLLDPINLGFETQMDKIKSQLDDSEVTNTIIGKVEQIQEIQRFLVNRSVEYYSKWSG